MADKNPSRSPILDLAKGITDPAFVLDLDRNIIEFNRPFTTTHQVDRRQLPKLKGSFCREHVKMEICETDCIVKKSIQSGAAVRFDEVKGSTSVGDALNLIVSAVPIRDESGEIVSVLEIHRDVTDEARIHSKYSILLEKEKRAKEELQRQVEEQTKELRHALSDLKKAEANLVHSEKMSSLGQMVAGIAHELNNPINFIYGNVESIQEYIDSLSETLKETENCIGSKPEILSEFEKIKDKHDIDFVLDDAAKITTSIKRGSERAAEIIKGLRSFSRLDEAQLKETNLHDDIDTTLTLLGHEHKGRITIHKEYGDVGLVKCFASQLNQVFMNLLHNAIQAISDQGDIWIRTRIENNDLVVEIEDNGMGIPPENMKKIFDPFFTSKEVGKGTGLGLSISYGIVERHKGKIEVESTVGKGTKFRVRIPRDLKE